ncbi:TMEM175 family protein [Buchananella felis]|uniref:TMEM175 family protein n=1 Tax=Buchananella felis TaxID=3231492 RepID=UPI00352800AA
MTKGRLEAFSDGVLAIVITIMVLKLDPPAALDWDSIVAVAPTFAAYVLSFSYVGVYWVNHHNLFSKVETVSGKLVLKNLHWLFWMTLIPFAMEWVGMYPFDRQPATLYSVVLLMCSANFQVLQRHIAARHRKGASPTGRGNNLRGWVAVGASAAAIALALFVPVASYLVFFLISLLWLIPGARVERFYDRVLGA